MVLTVDVLTCMALVYFIRSNISIWFQQIKHRVLVYRSTFRETITLMLKKMSAIFLISADTVRDLVLSAKIIVNDKWPFLAEVVSAEAEGRGQSLRKLHMTDSLDKKQKLAD